MFITAHSSVAVFLGLQVANPVLAFVLGMVSHFVFDIIPHGDRGMARTRLNPERRLPEVVDARERCKFLLIAVVDNLIALAMLVWLSRLLPVTSLPVLLAVFGAALPDALQGVTAFTRFRFLDAYTRLHHRIHFLLPRDVSLGWGLILQGATLVLFLWLSLQSVAH